MSRCFPFPPPGYEKKVGISDIDLLAKEKHKEKKHKKDKKDKKDKEKRDGKEKKDKDRSKEKHGERKDRKEKHKDKKERGGDNGITWTSEEKRIEGQPESYNGQNHVPNGFHNVDIKDYKYVQELDRRYRNDDRATGSQVVQKILVADQRSLLSNQSREKERIKDKKEVDRTVNAQRNHVEGKTVQNVPSIDQRRLEGITKPIEKQLEVYRNGERATGSLVVQKIMVSDQKPLLPTQSREKERIKDKKEDDRTANAQRNHVEGKCSAEEFFENFPSIEQRRLEGIAKPIEKDVEKQMEGRDRKKHTDNDSKGHKPKERDKEKKVKSKDKDRDKKKEKKEKVKEISKPSDEQPKLEGNGKESLDAFSNKALNLLQMNSKNSAAGGILGKRKELEMNGYLHENGFLPHKLPRSVSSHPVVENGRKSESSQTVLQFLSEGQGAASNCKADIKEHRINGLRGPEQLNAFSTKPSSSRVKVNENGGASAKPPHPDSKYLNEILSIPKMADESNLDDQEWLLSGNGSGSKKPKVGSPEIERTPQVWAEAMQIESLDVYALPYVIPY
ncbi:hypothetical protein ACE6H2_028059 [Prunus campanulata]